MSCRVGFRLSRPVLRPWQQHNATTNTLPIQGYLQQAHPRRTNLARLLPQCTSSTPQRVSNWRSYATRVAASELQFGQPVHETHPHILKSGELTPGITAQEYYDRRLKLAALLPVGGVAILAAADLKYRSGAVFYPYRQDSNFFYLTGFAEQDAVAVIHRRDRDPADHEFRLYVRPKDPILERWSGPWSGVEGAEDVWNADVAGPIAAASYEVRDKAESALAVFADSRDYTGSSQVQPLAPLVNSLRAIKSPAEVANMRKAGQLSGRVITDAMRGRRDGSSSSGGGGGGNWTLERDLALFLEHGFARAGCDGSAYVPVVAGGPRGSLIHYVQNSAALAAGETVLVDAGGEFGTYVTDITRTWPVGGRFSPAQRDLYEAVLRVQRTCVSLCRASAATSLDRLHAVAERALADQLRDLGFDLPAGPAGSSDRGMSALFPHHLSHYVGLDVHDVPGYSRGVQLQAGHCVTVEPGIYVPDDDRWPSHFRGLAVRIEDSVCVMEDEPLILTTEAVKEVADIEALREV
ncbi:xaa-Pro dipeptidase [Gaeumannomyces tritici R3-111a-1]|uniref:Xaa-Pro aminopeptidase n=1 Tax=Gaeumannomyces tritici (strain R3-111a-1) TaxID=644352 RepID=J3NFT3_GAET3|nr:xaa-Pro dipeptidase [Gaeumannomyces tritici R3-111a-1]EJT80123.1 xaa-Pro dipeptidase [Gaeumannomyces tritici R3-111a-1]